MAKQSRVTIKREVASPQHYAPPSAAEKRAHAVHRMQIGLLGLAAMLLMVGLASIIANRVRLQEAAFGPGDVAAKAAAKQSNSSDAMADIGVAPATNPNDTAVAKKPVR